MIARLLTLRAHAELICDRSVASCNASLLQ
jgi:hypothetical protein